MRAPPALSSCPIPVGITGQRAELRGVEKTAAFFASLLWLLHWGWSPLTLVKSGTAAPSLLHTHTISCASALSPYLHPDGTMLLHGASSLAHQIRMFLPPPCVSPMMCVCIHSNSMENLHLGALSSRFSSHGCTRVAGESWASQGCQTSWRSE